MNKVCKRPSELTDCEIEHALHSFLQFYEIAFFSERGIDESQGITLALEQIACMLGLVGDWLYDDDDYDSADLMYDFIALIDIKAKELNSKEWEAIKPNLPYLRGL